MSRLVRRARRVLSRPAAWLGPKVGLRWRITLGFGVGALTLAVVLSAIAYGITRESLLDQREGSVRSQAIRNAQSVQGAIGSGEEPGEAFGRARRTEGATLLLHYDHTWFSDGASVALEELPEDLVAVVLEEGQPARMRFSSEGSVYAVVGIPLDLDGGDAAYFDVVPLDDVESALESLTIALIAAGTITALGGALVGWVGAHRTLRPLKSIRIAAGRLAGGDLTTRVEAGTDPDLVPLAGSFNRMVDALRDRIEQDARFSSNVAHELRSPLTTLAASLAVLENMNDELPERAQTAVDLLTADVDRFTQLIEDLLEISRLDAGVVNLELDRVLIAELVLYAVDEESDRNIPVDVSGEVTGAVIQVDKRRVLRVIANLLDNAAKYAGGADRVEMRKVDDMVQIAVEDLGPGVAVKDRQRVFDRFGRGWVEGERAKRKGVGLGLSIVVEHVRSHGGQVWVEARADGREGARFVFTLPIQDEAEIADLDEEDLSLPPETPAAGVPIGDAFKDRAEA